MRIAPVRSTSRPAALVVRTDDVAARQRTEHSLAIARGVLAAGCLVAAYTGDAGAPPIVFTLLVLYAAHSFLTLALLTGRTTIPRRLPVALHAADLVWAGALTLVTEGPASPFFAMFAFVMLAAAYRWRRRETLLTGAVAGATLALQTWLLNGPAAAAGLPLAQVSLEWTAVRGAHLAVTAVLLGYLAEDDKLHRAQVAAMSELLSGIQSQPGFHAALRYAAGTLMSLTGSERLALAAKETGPGRNVLWTATGGAATRLALASSALARESEPPYFFSARGDAWSITQRGAGCRITSLNAGGEPVSSKRCEVPADFFSTHGARAAAIVSVGFGGHWKGRVFLFREKGFTLTELRFIHKVLCQLVPAMHNQYLLRRLRSRVSAVERRRIARELHDGVIQSLVGLELQTAALRRRLGNRDVEVDEQLDRIQRLLRNEALAIRDVMHQIRPVDAGPGELLPSLAEIVDRFSRDSDIVADFHSREADIYLPPRIARELARTLQEALTNVRKHAHATYVRVTLDARGPFWELSIENDGRPFPFMGRMTLRELEAGRLGPRVIKERVREMGGDLLIESSSDRVRLEISLPRADEQPKSA